MNPSSSSYKAVLSCVSLYVLENKIEYRNKKPYSIFLTSLSDKAHTDLKKSRDLSGQSVNKRTWIGSRKATCNCTNPLKTPVPMWGSSGWNALLSLLAPPGISQVPSGRNGTSCPCLGLPNLKGSTWCCVSKNKNKTKKKGKQKKKRKKDIHCLFYSSQLGLGRRILAAGGRSCFWLHVGGVRINLYFS